ncbi:NUDIX domain-containing protein [Nocardiopsis listeri]|uniref:NUDIX domain-containing protein n=1 Tax=Nocardiopsis listeri TaxID=53440 RepID=UPI00082AB17D|nr:NUDIX domain-containing protein [Nocardiopsis listeri]
MTVEPMVDVRFDDTGLVATRAHGEDGTYRLVRPGHSGPDGTRCSLSLAEALHARIRPVGSAETVLREWVRGGPIPATVPWDDPAATDPVRVRAGAIVIRDDLVLLIEFEDEGEPFYEIPGGGVEEGETPRAAVLRELWEETRLAGTMAREVAHVWKDGRREHYFLLEAEGEVGALEDLDTGGGVPRWIPVDRLPTTPVWPRRLAWRIAHWYAAGWPTRPTELADSIRDLRAPCDW